MHRGKKKKSKLYAINSELYVRVKIFPKTLSTQVIPFPITLRVNIQYIE